MPQITIEYMIMIPMLILQIFLFPLTAGWIMTTWVDSRQTLALQETASHVGSTIQQVYSALNHQSISNGTVSSSLSVTPFIEGHAYRGNATLSATSEPALNSSKILEITFTFIGGKITTTTSVTLGPNAEWDSNSAFMSNSTSACLNAEKMSNGTIRFSFGGDE